MKIEFTPESDLGKALVSLWEQLENDRGARAELRRCDSVDEVAMTPTYQRFCQLTLRPLFGSDAVWEDRMAAVVGLIAHLRMDGRDEVLKKGANYVNLLAEQMTVPVSGDRPLVSELRFRRLLQKDRADLYSTMLRIIRMQKGKASLFGIAQSVFFWGDGVKKRWAYAYFPKVPAKKWDEMP